MKSKLTKEARQQLGLMSPKDVGQSREAEAALTKQDNLQFLSLIQGTSGALKENDPEGVRAGDYVLGKRINLGSEFDAIVSISRPRAAIFENNQMVLESYDPSSVEWSKIKSTKKGGNTGIEFLLYVPDHGVFCTFWFKNTGKAEGANAVVARETGTKARFTSRLVKGKENSWFVPVVSAGDPVEAEELPPESQQAAVIASFDSYKAEKAAEPSTSPRPR